MFKEIEKRLVQAGLVEPGNPFIGFWGTGFLETDPKWNQAIQVRLNQDSSLWESMAPLFDELGINSIILSEPAEPYKTIINYLMETSDRVIYPLDFEVHSFLQDFPIIEEVNTEQILSTLKKRKTAIIKNTGIIATSNSSLEKAYFFFSSLCSSCFILFFSEYLKVSKQGKADEKLQSAFEKVISETNQIGDCNDSLIEGPLKSSEMVKQAIAETGRAVVEKGLVDSICGNISGRLESTLFISRTSSSLDNLQGAIEPYPLESSNLEGSNIGSLIEGLKPSSDLPIHLEIIKKTRNNLILHGHPRFSVILSLDCDVERGESYVCNTPVVSGGMSEIAEVLKESDAVIVFGHGIFSVGEEDFNLPFQNMMRIENECRKEYLRRLGYR